MQDLWVVQWLLKKENNSMKNFSRQNNIQELENASVLHFRRRQQLSTPICSKLTADCSKEAACSSRSKDVKYLLWRRLRSQRRDRRPPIFHRHRSQAHCNNRMDRGDNSVAEVKRETGQTLSGQQEGCGPQNHAPEHRIRQVALHFRTFFP